MSPIRRFLVGTFVVLGSVGAGIAQTEDLAKILTGRWDGSIEFWSSSTSLRSNPNRTLVITTVVERDGKTVAQGQYGISGRELGAVDIEILPSGNRVSLKFETGDHNSVSLQLLQQKYLVGRITLRGVLPHPDRQINFEKVQ